jgi:hypothetical protein
MIYGTVDAVYILGAGSLYADSEIRYSVRSLCKHVRNLRHLCIVGQRPVFLRTGKFIPFGSPFPCKDANIAGAMLMACRDKEISDPFFCVHDDHFILQDVAADEFPAYFSGDVFRSSNRRYDRDLKAGLSILLRLGVKKPLCFETHTPILVHKVDMLLACRPVSLDLDSFTVKTLYANQCDRLKKVQLDDYKIVPPLIDWTRLKGRPCFSTSPVILDDVKELLKKLYPKASPFEGDA